MYPRSGRIVTSSVMAGTLGLLLASLEAGNESRFTAFALTDQQFEVIADFSENSIYWCGAATYARAELSVPGTQKIYVVQGPAGSVSKPGETAVRFGLSQPSGTGAVPGFTNDVDIVGNSMSLGQALQTCNERSASG